MAEKQKLNELFVLTSFLCCFVVMIHLTSAPIGSLLVGSWQQKIFFMGNKALSFVVPGFIFLSGLKLTHSYRNKEFHFGEFLQKRFLRIFLPYVFWYVAYYALFRDLEFMEHKTLSQHLSSFLLGDIVSPFYFITTICQFYLLFGLFLFLFQKFHHKLILLISSAVQLLYLQFVFPPYEDRLFITYFIYFVLGCYAAYHLEEFRKFRWYIYLIFFFLTGWHVVHAYGSAYLGMPYSFWRVITCCFCISAILAFYHFSYWLSRHLPKWAMTCAKQMDKASYGVFLCHSYIIYLCSEKWAELGIISIVGKFLRSTAVVYPAAFFGTFFYLFLKKILVSAVLHRRNM